MSRCALCGRHFEATGGWPQKYCTERCKWRMGNVRTMERVRASQPPDALADRVDPAVHRLLTELVRWAVCALVLSGPRGTATRITRELGKAQGWAQKIVSELRDVAGEDAVNVTPPSDQERVT